MADVSRYRRVRLPRVLTAVGGGALVMALAATTPAARPGVPDDRQAAAAPAARPAGPQTATSQAQLPDAAAGHQATVTQYCVTCHNDLLK